MPIVGPVTAPPVTIATLSTDVVAKVENRVSDLARVETWLRDAILEIAAAPGYRNEFDELETTGPQLNLTVGQQEYNDSLFINTGDVNLNFLDFVLWQDPPNNTNRKQLVWKSYQYVDRNRQSLSLPANWYRYHSLIGFDPLPNQAYLVQARYYRLHPIDDSCLSATEVLLPREWHDIIVLVAAQKGFIELLEYEKAQGIHTLLFGDPKDQRKPGLIAGRLKRKEREMWRREAGLTPVVRLYSPRGR